MRYDREAHIQLFGDRQVAQQYVSFARKLLGQLYTYNHALSPITPSGYSTRTIRLEDGATIQVIWTGALPVLRIFSPPFKPAAEKARLPSPREITGAVYGVYAPTAPEYRIVFSDLSTLPPTEWATVPGLIGKPLTSTFTNEFWESSGQIGTVLSGADYAVSPDLTRVFHLESFRSGEYAGNDGHCVVADGLAGTEVFRHIQPVGDTYSGAVADAGYISAIHTDGRHIYLVGSMYVNTGFTTTYGFEFIRVYKYSLVGALIEYVDEFSAPEHRSNSGGISTYFSYAHIHAGYMYFLAQYWEDGYDTARVRLYSINLATFKFVTSIEISQEYSQLVSLGGAGPNMVLYDIRMAGSLAQVTLVSANAGQMTITAQFDVTRDERLNPGQPEPCAATNSYAVLSAIWEQFDRPPEVDVWGLWPILDINTAAYTPVGAIPDQSAEFEFAYPTHLLSLAS